MDILARTLFQPEQAKKAEQRLVKDASETLRADRDRLAQEVRALQLRVLGHDKKELRLFREARSATDEAETLYEAVELLARGISDATREGRRIRKEVRVLLESKGLPPPYSLGSSRKRKKKTKSKKKTS
jgi:hypothetical protein